MLVEKMDFSENQTLTIITSQNIRWNRFIASTKNVMTMTSNKVFRHLNDLTEKNWLFLLIFPLNESKTTVKHC